MGTVQRSVSDGQADVVSVKKDGIRVIIVWNVLNVMRIVLMENATRKRASVEFVRTIIMLMDHKDTRSAKPVMRIVQRENVKE